MQLVVCYVRCLCASAGLPASLEVTWAYSIYGFQISTYGFKISTHGFQISTYVFSDKFIRFSDEYIRFLEKNSNGHMKVPYLDRHMKGHTKNCC